MGYYTPVPLGDYMAGSNHTLPTTRSVRFSGGLNPLVFLRAQSWIYAKTHPHALLTDTARFARLEGLNAHAASANVRRI
jgi:histidinol dehydrogenase